ncbi:glycosyltransferase family 25 protein [Halodesulfovibrio aestuarii]|uniref:glycosyltransferase family 25 protein n=1 Tax=Halodesulfovibrio aestuarii TaxID=126333 RepID=UPI003D359205
MKIFIINLERSADRRSKMEARLKELNLTHEFFNAVDGSENNFRYSNRYDSKKRLLLRGRELQRGQIANFASHISLWEQCVELDTPIVVLEDDAVLKDNFPKAVTLASQQINDFGCIRLYGNKLNKHKIVRELDDTYKIALSIFGTTCSNAYALHPSAAKKMLAHCSNILHSIDVYMNHSYKHGVPCYVLTPMPVAHDTSQPTTINHRVKTKKTLLQKIVRELNMLYIRTATLLTSLRHIIRK